MALFRWRGTTSSAFNVDSNWVDSAGTPYAAGRYPGSVGATYDDVIFDQALAGGANSLAGYDGAALESLLSFKVGAAYDGTIGSAGAWLRVDVDATGAEVVIDGTAAGDIYLNDAGGALNRVTVIDTKSTSTLYLDGSVSDLAILKGTVNIAATCAITTAFYIGYVGLSTDAAVTIASGATFPVAVQQSGTVTCSAASANNLHVYGGTWIQSAGNLSGVCFVTSGTLQWDNGTLTDARVFGGTLDCSQSVLSRTMTNARVYRGGTIDLDNGVGNITLTNPIEVVGGNVTFRDRDLVS